MKTSIRIQTIFIFLFFTINLRGQQLPNTVDTIYKKTIFYNDENMISLPDSIFNHKSIRELVLVGNCSINWQIVATQLKGFEKIITLAISHHDLRIFPKELTSLNNIENLDLRNNILRYFPPEVELMNINFLDMDNNHLNLCTKKDLDTLFYSMSYFTKIKRLSLDGNDLNYLPKSIVNLKSIESLNIANNSFIDLPKIIYKMDNLIYLRIDCYPTLLTSKTDLSKIKNLKIVFLNMSFNSKLKSYTSEEYEYLCKKYPKIQFM
jgi:Leucine-rich repeat (LRR) protein